MEEPDSPILIDFTFTIADAVLLRHFHLPALSAEGLHFLSLNVRGVDRGHDTQEDHNKRAALEVRRSLVYISFRAPI